MKYFLMMMLCISSLVATAQKKKAESLVPVKPSPDSLFSNLKWRNIGPFRGGRANAVSGVVGNDQKFYAGYTGVAYGPQKMVESIGKTFRMGFSPLDPSERLPFLNQTPM